MRPRSAAKIVVHYPTITSTQDQVAPWSKQLQGPVAIFADYQSAGRGQRSASWWAPPKSSLLCSVHLQPAFLSIVDHFIWNAHLSLQIAQVLSDQAGLPIRLKWPNDLMVGERKIGGLLLHNAVHGQHIRTSNLGLGINLSQLEFPSTLPHATSVQLEGGQPVNAVVLLRALILAFAKAEQQIAFTPPKKVLADYRQQLFGRGQWRSFRETGAHIWRRGRVKDIQHDGALVVEFAEKGNTKSFYHKEIEWQLGNF